MLNKYVINYVKSADCCKLYMLSQLVNSGTLCVGAWELVTAAGYIWWARNGSIEVDKKAWVATSSERLTGQHSSEWMCGCGCGKAGGAAVGWAGRLLSTQ